MNAPETPARVTLQALPAIGRKTTIPAFFALITLVILPLFDGLRVNVEDPGR